MNINAEIKEGKLVAEFNKEELIQYANNLQAELIFVNKLLMIYGRKEQENNSKADN